MKLRALIQTKQASVVVVHGSVEWRNSDALTVNETQAVQTRNRVIRRLMLLANTARCRAILIAKGHIYSNNFLRFLLVTALCPMI